MAIRTDVAEAVKAELNAVATVLFPPDGFVAVRRYQPPADLTDLKELAVTVMAKSYAEEVASRSATGIDIEVDVGIQQKVQPEDAAAVDGLVNLVEKVLAFMWNHRLSDLPAARWTRQVNELPYIPEHLSEKRLFTSVITLTYRLVVSV